jgi:hypothetical protein
MSAAEAHPPGRNWLSIVSRPTLTDFARAFVEAPLLEASVLSDSVRGVASVRAFFNATRAMYDAIEFTAEHHVSSRTWLEWRGEYRARPISGVTVLTTEPGCLIAHVHLFHLPLDQVTAFASDVQHRLSAGNQGELSCR